jgi:dihydroorotate dehydrogenase (NAD+) catalytic subunit
MDNQSVDLSVTIGKLKLKNPVIPSSGTFGYGIEYADFLDLNALGGMVLKATTLKPRIGNFENRFIEVAGCCFLSCVGLQNVGVERFIKEKIPPLRKFNTAVIVNMACESLDEFTAVTEALKGVEGIHAVEINLACPNVKGGGMSFAADPDMTFKVVKTVRSNTDLPVIAKFYPSLVDVITLSKTCQEAGADAVCPIHSPVGMAIDINTRKSRMGKNLTGGLSGPGLKPAALRLAYQAAQAVKIPVIGGGGVGCAEDALEFIIAGATAVSIGAFNLINPGVAIEIVDGIRQYMVKNKLTSLDQIRGSLITQ